jgi:1,5-anhydro-D-fructose reductase (1,5-anhydro-D-mannitol-forming)
MSENKIGWGLIGASTIARQWMVDAIRSNPDSEVVAIASGDRERASAFAAEKGIPNAYGSVAELLQNPEVDAVYISSTNEQHAPQAIAAAEAGKHVLCEKPLAMDAAQAEAVVEACRRAGVVLGTNHHLRNMESHRAIKRLIDEGAVGTVTAIRVFHAGELPESLKTWRLLDKGAGGGVILDIAVHDADLLRFYLGRNPNRITAIAATSGSGPRDVEDSVMSIWEFPGNVLAQCHDSFVVGTAPRGVEVHGTGGSLLGLDIMSQAPGGSVILRTREGADRTIPFESKVTYERGVADFVAAIHGRGRPSATG